MALMVGHAAPFAPCGRHEVDGYGMAKCFGAERSRCDDPGAADVNALQRPGAMIAGHQMVGVAGNSHRQQERVERLDHGYFELGDSDTALLGD